MHRWRALAIVPVAAMLLSGPVFAQDSTPTADEGENPRLVAPKECVAEPRPVDQLTTILGLDGEGVPPPAKVTLRPPLGEVADLDTTLAIKEAAREVVACFNAGDVPRASALMTENGVKRAYWALTVDQASRDAAKARFAAAPQPRDEQGLIRLIAVTDVSKLPDGRYSAFVVINEPLLAPPGPETLLFIFANENGAWHVDDWVDFSIVPSNFGTATPTS
jgi:hypothetical protein